MESSRHRCCDDRLPRSGGIPYIFKACEKKSLGGTCPSVWHHSIGVIRTLLRLNKGSTKSKNFDSGFNYVFIWFSLVTFRRTIH